MNGIRTFLKLGEQSGTNISDLINGGYEILHCSFSFHQGIDAKGQAQTLVKGGEISIVIDNLPTNEIIDWGMDCRKFLNGEIIFCDENNQSVQKLAFIKAACVEIRISYTEVGDAYAQTRLSILAEQLILGENSLNNEWKN